MAVAHHRSIALVTLGVTIILAALPGLPCAAQDESPTVAPENPSFLRYVEDPYILLDQQAESGFVTGIVPDPVDFSYLRDIVGGGGIVALATLPSTYDLRALGRVTPVRNQGGCGSCWSFAAYGSLESNLMPGASLNLSENNLKNRHGFDLSCCSGGNRAMATAYLARWEGAVSETQDPYGTSSCTSPSGLPPVRHVQDVIYIPTRSGYLDNDALKKAVMTYGGVYTVYYHSDIYYNMATAAYYYTGGTQANHGVCIVGWDDSFDKSKFRTPPPGNGAFIVRNSWGTYWGLSGYFYLSYYDTRLASENGAFIGESATNYDRVYQYDTLGWTSSAGYGSTTAWFGNVFTAAASSKVAAASFYTPAPNATYEVRVYLSPTSGPVNTSGPAVTTAGTIASVGYHTIKIPTPVPITSGQKFAVVVKLTTPGYGYPIALERPYSGFSSKAIASPGQSYMSSNGTTWTDVAVQYTNSNVCLKAFTSGVGEPAPGALSVAPAAGLTSSGPAGGPFNPSSQAYTLTNSGGQSLAWTAARTRSWVSLSSTSGTLAPGTSTTVTVGIAADASSLALGSYADTVTFANATNGTGNTTRSVTLAVTAATPPGALAVTPATGLTSAGMRGGPFSPSSQIFTVSNTGGEPLSWAVAATQPWVTMSPTGGTIAAGASASVTVSINSAANSLAVGSYIDTVSFANTTNGSGNTTRPVSLTVNASAPTTGYRVVPTTFGWIDPASHTTVSLVNNSVSTARSMPFSFDFFGTSYNRLYVAANGMIGFSGTNGMYSAYNTVLPTVSAPNGMICPYWDQLVMTGGQVKVGTVGSAPNRRMVISWVNVAHYYSSTTKFTFQAVLCEGTNDIVLQYLNSGSSNYVYGGGGSATIGIENATGAEACLYSYNTRSIANNTALLFTRIPNAQSRYRFVWPRR